MTREVHIIVHGSDGQALPNATIAWYERKQILTTGPDGSVSVFADSSVTDVGIKVIHPDYQPYLEDPVKLLPPRNCNVGIGIPVGPTDVQFPPLVPNVPPPPPVDLRHWQGNMCGIRVNGLQPVPGIPDGLVLSWFYHAYGPQDRATMRQGMHERGLTHWLLSWSDVRRAGYSAEYLASLAMELQDAGFAPAIMLTGKYDLADLTVPQILQNALDVLPTFLKAGVKLFSIGWELSLWLTATELQTYIDAMAPVIIAAGAVPPYVHFQEGYFSWQQPGHDSASFWNKQVGKLNGILHQKMLSWSDEEYAYRIVDCLDRFSGQFNFVTDSGFGRPFDFVALEVTAMQQYDGQVSEAEGDRVGAVAMAVPPVIGPTGAVSRVIGFGNGSTR